MIRSLRIRNFQSHKDSGLEFDPHVNIVCGSSNSGKSVIVRALNWCIRNKASSAICSNWNLSKSGEPVENIEVEVATDKGVCARVRGKKNGYVLNGTEYNAIGRDVPAQVDEFFNLNETNVQSQMDSPFLLSLNGPDATKFVNKVVRLDCIDSILSKAERERRDLNSEAKIVEKDITSCEEEIRKLAWVEKAEAFQSKIDAREEEVAGIDKEWWLLDSEIEQYRDISGRSAFPDVSGILNEIDSELDLLAGLERELGDLSDEVSRVGGLKFYDLSEANGVIQKIEELMGEIDPEPVESLEREIGDYRECAESRERLDSETAELRRGFPEVCPLCGSKMEGECCGKR